MKILLATYSAESHTSYGLVTRELWSRLAKMNPTWQIYQQGWFHKSNEKVGWHIEPTRYQTTAEGPRPVHEDRWGQLSFETVVSRFKPDVVWALGDPYMMEHMDKFRRPYGFKLIKHVAVDGAPQPASWGDSLKSCDRLVPITEFGARALEPIVGAKHQHIYHGVDVNRFTPVDRKTRRRPEMMRMTAKTFVLGFVGHSQWRKQPWNLFKLLRHLRDGAYVVCQNCDEVTLSPWDDINMRPKESPTVCSHCRSMDLLSPGPKDVALWYHTFNRPSAEYHPEILKNIWGVNESVIFTAKMESDEGAADKDMPELYRNFDAYLSLSGGEGFCIPIVEAMATGLPVVYTDYSGQAEIGAYGGLPARYLELQPNMGVPVNRAVTDVGHAIRQVLRLMESQAFYDKISAKAVSAARDVFSWDLVACQWDEVIRSVSKGKSVRTIGYAAS